MNLERCAPETGAQRSFIRIISHKRTSFGLKPCVFKAEKTMLYRVKTVLFKTENTRFFRTKSYVFRTKIALSRLKAGAESNDSARAR